MKSILRITIVFIFIFAGLNCSYIPQKDAPVYIEPFIRVVLMKDARELEFRAQGTYEIIDMDSKEVLGNGRSAAFKRLTVKEDKICIDAECFATLGLRINPSKTFSIMRGKDERQFRGMLIILREKDSDGFLVINSLGLEGYIKGVLPHEISERWPLEAIKAQAVATRTYAQYQMSLNIGKPFDVTADIYSQVYGGLTAEHYRTNIGVERTKGEVLFFEGKILPAYFHAACGGSTEDASRVWKHSDITPLKGVRCPFCTLSPHYRWQKSIPLKEISEKLNSKGHNIGVIKMIEILDRNPSYRINKIKFIDDQGKDVTLMGKDFRILYGPNAIRSNSYRLFINGDKAEFTGLGWGHGVGLCQWGALGMSRKGYDYAQILAYYYPGAELK